MSENWFPHVRAGEKGPTACMIDLQHRGGAGDPQRPILTIAEVRLKSPGDSGMGDHADVERLDNQFDGPAAELGALDAIFIARTRGQGLVRFMMYSSPARRSEIERLIRGAFPNDRFEFEHREDPGWTAYEQLLPTAAELRLVYDQMVVDALQKHGDPLTPKRDVQHWIYFDTERSASRFAESIRGEGFKVELSPPSDNQPRYAVIASRNDSVVLEAINKVTTFLSERARALGGVYDGWEAGLAKPRGLLSRLFSR